MRNSALGIAALASIFGIAMTAHADNATVESALKSRPDLSTFYNGLVSTGVLHELSPNQPYTVFAPTNEAFSGLSQDKYPCFYSITCKAQVAAVLRRHIVPGEKHLEDVNSKGEGGVYSLFSIDNQHLVATEPNKDTYMVDDQKILSENQLLGGELYVLNGLLIRASELVQFEAPTVVTSSAVPTVQASASPQAEKVVIETKTDATTPIPY